MRAWIRPALMGVGLIVVITLGLAACGHAATPAPGGATSPAPSQPAPSRPPPPGTHTSPPPTPSAATQLTAFFAAAEHADGQLHHAAALVNGDIGATSMRFTPATLEAVRAVAVTPVAAAVPAGLPSELLREVLVVYGDLASRRAAFTGVAMYGLPWRSMPVGGADAKSVLRGLHNGAPAAARFDGDLASARALARQTPPVTVAAPDSRAAAELALRIYSLDLGNNCSETFGGYTPTSFDPIVWQPSTDQHSGHYAGRIGSGGRFQADYTAQHGWQVTVNAC